jgi:hypothetical protein
MSNKENGDDSHDTQELERDQITGIVPTNQDPKKDNYVDKVPLMLESVFRVK